MNWRERQGVRVKKMQKLTWSTAPNIPFVLFAFFLGLTSSIKPLSLLVFLGKVNSLGNLIWFLASFELLSHFWFFFLHFLWRLMHWNFYFILFFIYFGGKNFCLKKSRANEMGWKRAFKSIQMEMTIGNQYQKSFSFYYSFSSFPFQISST